MSFITAPSPPTDNLYKFVAIAGLVFFFGGPFYWATFELKLQERQTAAWVSLHKQIEIPFEYLVPPRFEKTPEGNQAREKWEALKKSIDAQETEHIRVGEQLRNLERMEGLVSGLGIFFLALGAVMAVVSFRLWYRRVQVPQDLLLQKQLSDASRPPAA